MRYKDHRISVMSVILAVALCAVMLTAAFISGDIASAAYEAPEPVFGNYFTPDYGSKDEAMAAADALNEEICEEGFTLLKNDGNALPLGGGANVSIFGKSSSELLYGLSSNYVHLRGSMTTLSQSLLAAGFNVNPDLINFYASSVASGQGRGSQPTNGTRTFGYTTGETPVSMYTEELEESYSEYKDAAIVVFSRSSGEGWDMPRTMEWDGKSYTSGGRGQKVPGARNMDDHYLQLDQNEADLLEYLEEQGFEKVIVLLNTPSQFETGFLDDPGHYAYHDNIKAALWVGYPGKTGINAVGRILKGEVNPSGKTVDTWARDFKHDPTWNNFSDNMRSGGNKYSNLSVSTGSKYVIYKEGIYIGYRYYETRAVEEAVGVYDSSSADKAIHGTETTQWDSWYDAHVVYPFGHGLSYTTFSQEIVADSSTAEGTELTADGKVSVTVKVTNTGDMPGKEVVQVYYTAPYTDGEIEKSHVVLAGFAKTDILYPASEADENKPNSENVAVTFDVSDMASYDYSDANGNGFKGYELDAGDYEIKLMRNSHEVIDSITCKVSEGIRVEKDPVTGGKIENRFDEVSDYLTDPAESGGLGEKYMSRSDFEGTFPKTSIGIKAAQWIVDGIKEWTTGNTPSYEDEDWFVPQGSEPTFGDDTGDIMLADLFGADYNDPLWSDFLDQISLNTAKRIVSEGSYRSGIEVAALGIPRVINAGQPAGYMSLFSGMEGAYYAFFASDVVTASSYNETLAHKKGLAIGNEALFGTGRGKSRFPGWYAPAADTHRSPFGGRNADYYSEDGLIAGKMASGIIRGAMEKGVFCFLKHFAVNDQEVDRIGILTWANEQSMREIYFKPFELGVKEGGTVAIMSALNRLGPTWVGGNRALLTDLLRGEWGFKGAVVTDSYIGGYSLLDQMLLAGGDLALGSASGENSKIDNATELTALRNSVHNVLYIMANSMAMNTGYAVPPELIKDYVGFILPIGSVGLAYSADLGTAEIDPDAFTEGQPIPGNDEIVYALKEGSVLPEGLSLSADGMLTGTPKEEAMGTTFIVTATYENCLKEAQFSINITSSNGSIVYDGGSECAYAVIGEEYSFSVGSAEIYKNDATEEEIEAFPPITYSLADASALPEGLSLSRDGVISGTPTKECTDYEFTVVASALGFFDTEKTFSISVGFTLGYEGRKLADGKIGHPYLARVDTAECRNEVTYSLKQGSSLPAGLTLTDGGIIVGTPTETVTDLKVIVIASAEFGRPSEAEFVITVGMAFNDFELPDGEAGTEYYASVNTAQGAEDPVYALKEGSVLPDGLTLGENGVISGTPEKGGTYTITVTVNAAGRVGDEITKTLYIAGKDGGENSDGWKVAVGICVPVAAIAVAAIVFFAVRARKKGGKTDNDKNNK